MCALSKELRMEENPWGPPDFIAAEQEHTSGWGPTTYYLYYPRPERTLPDKIIRKKFNDLLVWKSGEIVVTGRTVEWDDKARALTGALIAQHETVNGIIPKDAPEGFYNWNGKEWEPCEEVVVKATSVSIEGRKPQPAYFRFIGLRGGVSGKLIQLPEEHHNDLLRQNQFYQIRPLKTDEESNLPVMETHVDRAGWFDAYDYFRWTEPNLTEGVEPGFQNILDHVKDARITRSRLGKSDDHFMVHISIGGSSYDVEYWGGSPGISGRNFATAVQGEPSRFIQHTPGRTYMASYFQGQGDSLRLGWLERMIQESPWQDKKSEKEV